MDATVRLNNGAQLPRYGLGLSHNGGFSAAAVEASLAAGVRLFDTATRYCTEAPLREALEAARVAPADVFVTTKLWPGDADDPSGVPAALDDSLARLGLEQVSLYLVHWPGTPFGDSKAAADAHRLAVWRQMELAVDRGAAATVGVSNFQRAHLEPLLEECSLPPAVNQIEWHVGQQDAALRAFCEDRGVHVQAYSPLGKGQYMRHPVVRRVAARHAGADAAQVQLAWALALGLSVVPKSTNPEHVATNALCWDVVPRLSDADMEELAGIEEGARVTWDPSGVV